MTLLTPCHWRTAHTRSKGNCWGIMCVHFVLQNTRKVSNGRFDASRFWKLEKKITTGCCEIARLSRNSQISNRFQWLVVSGLPEVGEWHVGDIKYSRKAFFCDGLMLLFKQCTLTIVQIIYAVISTSTVSPTGGYNLTSEKLLLGKKNVLVQCTAEMLQQ